MSRPIHVVGQDWEHACDALVDVVVVGSGAAGYAAALSAANAGASVIVLERGTDPGGTTAKAGAECWLPNNPLMQAEGFDDPREPALDYMCRLADPTLYRRGEPTRGLPSEQFALIESFYDNSARVTQLLVDLGALQARLDLNTPDYHADLDEDHAPYGRHLLQRRSQEEIDTQQTGGTVLIARMRAVGEAMSVDLRLGHRVVGLLTLEDGSVVGVEVHIGRRTEIIGARRGVVFASGGFLHDRELAKAFLRGPVLGGCAADTCTGDFVRLGIAAGAQLGNMSNAWWDQVVVETALTTPSTIEDVWMPFGASMVQVNRFGDRVVNEKMVYNERAQAHFFWDAGRREYINRLLFMIYDDAVAEDSTVSSFRTPVPMPGQEATYVIRADSLEELAVAIDERLCRLGSDIGDVRLAPDFAERLRATIERFDSSARTGVDEQFGRGSTPIQLAWGGGDRADAVNPTMAPFRSDGRLHCIIVGAGALDTKGGPVVDTSARVLSTDGEPIPGLFGAGNCVASAAGQAYWSAGGTIGPALVFGAIAGEQAAASADRST